MKTTIDDPESRNLALVHLGEAARAVEKAKTVQDLKRIRDKAEAVRQYAKQAGESLKIQNHCAEIKLRAERKAGELLKEMPRARQGRPKQKGSTMEPLSTLDELGVDKKEAHRWQREADVPDGKFERWVAEQNASSQEVTQAGLLRVAQEIRSKLTELKPQPAGEAAAVERARRAVLQLSEVGRREILDWLGRLLAEGAARNG